MKYIKFYLFFAFTTVFSTGFCPVHSQRPAAQTAPFTSYPKEFQQIMNKLQQLPEFRDLLQQVRSKGEVRIVLSPSCRGNFEAYWDPNVRHVVINQRVSNSELGWVTSVVFELHNAHSEEKFGHLTDLACKGAISRAQFIQEVERIEHQNALNASRILRLLVDRGLYPPSLATWNISPSFEEHFATQQKMGHSSWIGEEYDKVVRHHRMG